MIFGLPFFPLPEEFCFRYLFALEIAVPVLRSDFRRAGKSSFPTLRSSSQLWNAEHMIVFDDGAATTKSLRDKVDRRYIQSLRATFIDRLGIPERQQRFQRRIIIGRMLLAIGPVLTSRVRHSLTTLSRNPSSCRSGARMDSWYCLLSLDRQTSHSHLQSRFQFLGELRGHRRYLAS